MYQVIHWDSGNTCSPVVEYSNDDIGALVAMVYHAARMGKEVRVQQFVASDCYGEQVNELFRSDKA